MKWTIDSFDTAGATQCDQCGKVPSAGKTMAQWQAGEPAYNEGATVYVFCLKCVAQYGDMLKVNR